MKIRTPKRPMVLVAALVVLAVATLAACGSPSSTDAGADPDASAGASADRISIQDFSFSPSTTTVAAGTTVTWTNDDSALHDVTSTDGPGTDASTTSTFASAKLSQGDTFSFTFTQPGTYYYECTIHAAMATMHGVVIVE